DRVVDMTTEVEGQILRQLVHIGEIARLTSRRQLLQRGVGTLDIGVVVLGVVQLHDLTRDRRRQRTVVVVEIGKCVLSHGEDAFWCRPRATQLRTPPFWTILPRPPRPRSRAGTGRFTNGGPGRPAGSPAARVSDHAPTMGACMDMTT